MIDRVAPINLATTMRTTSLDTQAMQIAFHVITWLRDKMTRSSSFCNILVSIKTIFTKKGKDVCLKTGGADYSFQRLIEL